MLWTAAPSALPVPLGLATSPSVWAKLPTWRYLPGQIRLGAAAFSVFCEACFFLCFVKPASLCVLRTSVSCHHSCVSQACLSHAIFLVCCKHDCLLLSFVCVSSRFVSCYLKGRPAHAALLHAYCCFSSVCL